MNLYKGTMFFIQSKQGWSESWVLNPPSPFPDLTTPETAFRTLADLRRACLGPDVTLDVIKITDLTAGNARRTKVSGEGTVGTFSSASANADASALIRYYDQNQLHYVMRNIRAVPQNTYAGNATRTLTNVFAAALTAFKDGLKNGGWGWLGRGVTTTATIANIVNIPGSPTVVSFTGTPLVGFAVGSRVRIRFTGILGATEVNGVQSCLVNTTASVIIPRLTAIDPYESLTGFGTIYGTPAFHSVFSDSFQRWDERKTGRPSYVSRGRRQGLRRI